VLTPRDERGFTLVELGVAMSIMLLVAGALLGALESGTNAERRASTRIDDEQSVRLALTQFTRDVRNATALIPGTNNPNQIDLSDGSAHISWSYDAASHVLVRNTYQGSTGHPGVSVGGLTNPADTVFKVLAQDGTNLFTLPGGAPADIVDCAAVIEASVTSAAHPPSAPFSESADAHVHNTGDQRGCP
jgi:prepilin-type N-terminal cleavage/methylation domain-containing protein